MRLRETTIVIASTSHSLTSPTRLTTTSEDTAVHSPSSQPDRQERQRGRLRNWRDPGTHDHRAIDHQKVCADVAGEIETDVRQRERRHPHHLRFELEVRQHPLPLTAEPLADTPR